MLRARGRGGVCLKSSGALEVCCRRVDVAVLRYEDLELRRHATGLETWRYGDLELGRCGAGAETWRHVEVWSSGAREACCRCKTCRRHRGMEVWRCAAGV